MHDSSLYVVAGPPVQSSTHSSHPPSHPPPHPPPHLPHPPQPPDQPDLVTDRLLASLDREEIKFDVQIGDGMDIDIAGENGRFLMTILFFTLKALKPYFKKDPCKKPLLL